VTQAPEREPEQQLAERVRAEHARSVLALVQVQVQVQVQEL